MWTGMTPPRGKTAQGQRGVLLPGCPSSRATWSWIPQGVRWPVPVGGLGSTWDRSALVGQSTPSTARGQGSPLLLRLFTDAWAPTKGHPVPLTHPVQQTACPPPSGMRATVDTWSSPTVVTATTNPLPHCTWHAGPTHCPSKTVSPAREGATNIG